MTKEKLIKLTKHLQLISSAILEVHNSEHLHFNVELESKFLIKHLEFILKELKELKND